MSEPIYLDNHSRAAPCTAAMTAGSLSLDGRLQFLYEFASSKPEDQFAFASSGAEAVQQVFFSAFLELARKEGKSHFATSCLEDAPTLMGLKRLEELGCYVKIAPATNNGSIDVGALADLINPRTALVSVSAAQGLTGVIQPVHEIAALCREKGALLHIDATMAAGKMILDFDCDYLTFSGDRIHSVQSSAALFAKAGRPLVPLWPGNNVDTGSLLALCAAAQQSSLYLDIMGLEVARLKHLFEERLMERVDAKILFADAARLPNVSAIAFPRVHQESLLFLLQRKGIAATIGGASSQHLSRLLITSGIEEALAHSAVSFALSRQTTEEEILRAVDLIAQSVEHLRRLSGDLF